MSMPRVYLSIDGDHACALLGENLQEGEAEFVKIDYPGGVESIYAYRARESAAMQAYEKLSDRIGERWPFEMGEGLEI